MLLRLPHRLFLYLLAILVGIEFAILAIHP